MKYRVGIVMMTMAAWASAAQRGLPVKGEKPGGGAFELIDFDGERPLYRATCNANAAISSGANLLWAAPYGVTGSGGTVGVWDASSARTTHQEYGGRVTTKDGSGATYDQPRRATRTTSANITPTRATSMCWPIHCRTT